MFEKNIKPKRKFMLCSGIKIQKFGPRKVGKKFDVGFIFDLI